MATSVGSITVAFVSTKYIVAVVTFRDPLCIDSSILAKTTSDMLVVEAVAEPIGTGKRVMGTRYDMGDVQRRCSVAPEGKDAKEENVVDGECRESPLRPISYAEV